MARYLVDGGNDMPHLQKRAAILCSTDFCIGLGRRCAKKDSQAIRDSLEQDWLPELGLPAEVIRSFVKSLQKKL